ncbi:MAG: electron transporter RnfD [Acidobacteria bacterium]|nr:MAG: electron transporter RnfD [Acidobacteriota bacterium]
MRQPLKITTSPHIKTPLSTRDIMKHVLGALIPVSLWAIYSFGLSVLFLLVLCTAAAVLTEHALCLYAGRKSTINDYSAAVTGLLLGLTLPPGFPLWMAVLGGIVAITLGKLLFGGLGFNVFNPALVGRAFLQAAFPVAITTWNQPFSPERFSSFFSSSIALPFLQPVYDAVTAATPLGLWKFDHQISATGDLVMGLTGGSAGETSAVLILLGGIYLACRNMLDWKIPVSILLTSAVLAAVLHAVNPAYPSAFFMLFSGGLMLGAVFMATDMVSSPVTPLGTLLYGALIGILVIVIRIWGGLPEGVMYSILLGNACVPIFTRFTQPRVFGTKKGGAK